MTERKLEDPEGEVSEIIQAKRFVAFFHFVGWDCPSAGVHVCFGEPNVEIHLPFGFVRLGWQTVSLDFVYGIHDASRRRVFGIDGHR